jgi:hypothetical protein
MRTFRSDIAHGRVGGVDAHTNRERLLEPLLLPAISERGGSLLHRERHPDRPKRVVLVVRRHGHSKDDQEAVADDLVEGRPAPVGDFGHRGHVLVQQPGGVLGLELVAISVKPTMSEKNMVRRRRSCRIGMTAGPSGRRVRSGRP